MLFIFFWEKPCAFWCLTESNYILLMMQSGCKQLYLNYLIDVNRPVLLWRRGICHLLLLLWCRKGIILVSSLLTEIQIGVGTFNQVS